MCHRVVLYSLSLLPEQSTFGIEQAEKRWNWMEAVTTATSSLIMISKQIPWKQHIAFYAER